MTYKKTLRYLYGLQTRGMKFGLENTQQLLYFLQNPHENFASVHIAGTNGKGSTAAMLAAVLRASGYRVGLYTSPHLVRFTERIRIGGEEIAEVDVAKYARRLRSEIERTKATFFEATTAIAFRYFADRNVDIAVIETGLGGRLDATNVVVPLLTIITSIGADHTDILGKTLEQIAFEKGGIIKPGVPCLVGEAGRRELGVLSRLAKRRGTRIVNVARSTRIGIRRQVVDEMVLDISSPLFSFSNVRSSLVGTFQKNNIALSLAAAHLLKKRGFRNVTENAVRLGLLNVRAYTGLRARLEIFSTAPCVFLDVAHNPDAMRSLVGALRSLIPGRCICLFGAMKDKDVAGMARELAKIARAVVVVAPKTARAMEPRAICELFHRMNARCFLGGSLRKGFLLALRELRDSESLLVTGSHFVVGEFLRDFEGKRLDIN